MYFAKVYPSHLVSKNKLNEELCSMLATYDNILLVSEASKASLIESIQANWKEKNELYSRCKPFELHSLTNKEEGFQNYNVGTIKFYPVKLKC